jgi:DNA mismatch repair ATPase MutS
MHLPCHLGFVLPAALLLDEKAILTLNLLAPSSSGGGAAAASGRVGSSSGAETLLQLLDRAASPAGRRLLRQWISRCAAGALLL